MIFCFIINDFIVIIAIMLTIITDTIIVLFLITIITTLLLTISKLHIIIIITIDYLLNNGYSFFAIVIISVKHCGLYTRSRILQILVTFLKGHLEVCRGSYKGRKGASWISLDSLAAAAKGLF